MPVASFEFAAVATITYHRLHNEWLCAVRQPAVISGLATLMCTGWSWCPFCVLGVHNVLGSKRPTFCPGGGGERATQERRDPQSQFREEREHHRKDATRSNNRKSRRDLEQGGGVCGRKQSESAKSPTLPPALTVPSQQSVQSKCKSPKAHVVDRLWRSSQRGKTEKEVKGSRGLLQ